MKSDNEMQTRFSVTMKCIVLWYRLSINSISYEHNTNKMSRDELCSGYTTLLFNLSDLGCQYDRRKRIAEF
jgi:hypothetical protein